MPTLNRQLVEYSALPKTQRLAIFLLASGPEIAAKVLSAFSEEDAQELCAEISKMQMIDESLRNESIKEFSGIIAESFGSILGGVDFVKKTLSIAQSSNHPMDNLLPGPASTDLLARVKKMDPLELYNLIKDEQSQTIAFLLSSLEMSKVISIIKKFPEEPRQEILEYMGSTQAVSLPMLRKLAKIIQGNAVEEKDLGAEKSDGVAIVAQILNAMGKDISKPVLSKMSETNAALSMAIGKKMFSFDDIAKLSIADLQLVSRDVETNDLVVALKGASKEVEEMFMKSVSKRAADGLRDEMEMLGGVKISLVREAQDKIVEVIKRLEEEGAISLDGDEEEILG